MLRRTHLAIGVGVGLHFLPYVAHEYIFFLIVLLATILPELDAGIPSILKGWISGEENPSTSHRGFLHSYTFCIPASLIIAFFYPVGALPFFLGYSFHLFADSFTQGGIRPFWPSRKISKGIIQNGSVTETAVFWTIIAVDVLIFIGLFI